jgi:TRAP-type C4-dicarboxylate transport system permease small subunit
MNTTIKTILIVAGLALLIYGGYELVTPEASVDLGIAEFESQNNTNAYISIGIGIVALIASFVVKKK